MEQILVGPLVPPSSEIGDAAIAIGAIRLLRKHFPRARIVGYFAGHPGPCGSAPAWARVYEVDDLVHSWQADPVSLMAKLWALVWCQSTGMRVARVAGPAGRLVSVIRGCDLVVVRGGGHLSSRSLRADAWLALVGFYEAFLARALGVPFSLWGYSVPELTGPLSKRLLWSLIRDSAIVACRERLSYEYLLSVGAPRNRLTVLPDTAFAVEPAVSQLEGVLDREGVGRVAAPLVAVNVRGARPGSPYSRALPMVLGAIAAALEWLHAEHGFHALVVPHVYSMPWLRVPSERDDRETGMRLAKMLGDPTWLHVLRGDYSPAVVAALYGRAEFTIACRLHAAILSAVAGRPALAISYDRNKFFSTAEWLGLGGYVLDYREVTPSAVLGKVQELWHSGAGLAAQVEASMKRISRELERYIELTLSRMPKATGEVSSTGV